MDYNMDYNNYNPLSRFLIALLGVALPVLGFALRYLYRYQQGGGRVSAFIISLLLSDLLELALIPALITILLRSTRCWEHTCIVANRVQFLYIVAKFCGLHFHQLVALEGILSLKHPLCSTRLSSLPCSLTLSLTVWLFVIICMYFYVIGITIILVSCLVPVGILAVTCVLTCRAPPSSDHAPYTVRRLGLSVLVVAMVTLIVLYAPYISCIISWILIREYSGQVVSFTISLLSVWMTTESISSLRVIADSLLCVLVCRENYRGQTPQISLSHYVN